MNANAKAWLKRLRSTRLKQTEGQLKDTTNNSYCVLGVACKMAEEAGVITEAEYADKNYPPKSVRDWLGLYTGAGMLEVKDADLSDLHTDHLPDSDTVDLTDLNDEYEASFRDLANIIEKNADQLFVADPPKKVRKLKKVKAVKKTKVVKSVMRGAKQVLPVDENADNNRKSQVHQQLQSLHR